MDIRQYYLQHMGLELWEKRSSVLQHTPSLILICDALTSKEENELLRKMLLSIHLLEEDVSIFFTNTNHLSDVEKQIAAMPPRALLILGESAEILSKAKPSYYQKIPCFYTYSPGHLIKNTADKKKAYHVLLAVQKVLLHETKVTQL